VITVPDANITLLNTPGDGQIKFPATQNASADANTLDDYEEGTWTPSQTNLTVVGSPTYTGVYTKIGRVVYWWLRVSSSTSTASTANSTYFTGLEALFTPALVSPCMAVNDGNITSLGNGAVLTNGRVYTPTWAASASVVVSGLFYV
jgi:hypothetical protein